MVEYTIISTGSKGNAVVIEKSILIDCGVSYKSLKPYIRELKLVLLTHVHGDHFKASTVRRLAEERPTLRFACGAWMILPLLQAGVNKKNIDVLKDRTEYVYNIGSVERFEVEHDVSNCGYKLEIPKRGSEFATHKIFYVTDAGNLNGIEAKNFDLYMIEGDYDNESLEQRISDKKASGEFIYERRVERNHLSKEQCQDFIAHNAGPDSLYIYMHEHAEKGEPHDAD